MPIFFSAPIDQYPAWNRVTTVPTVASVTSGFPATNLLTMDPTQAYKSAGQTAEIRWDFGQVRTFNVVSLLYTNLPFGSTWTVSTSPDGITYTVIYSGSALANQSGSFTSDQVRNSMLLRNASLYDSPSNIVTRYLRVGLDTLNAGILPSIGRLFVGMKYVPSTGWQYGSSYDMQDNSRRERTDRGALIVDVVDPIRVADVKMDFLSKGEMNDFILDFNYWRGASREILACLDTLDVINMQRNIFYANITEGRRVSFDSYNTHSVTWTLESIGVG